MSGDNLQNEFRVRIADLNIEIRHYEDYVKRQCREYLADSQDPPVITAGADWETIEKERRESGGIYSKGYCESICICREIARSLLPFQGFLLHAAVIDMDGSGYAFTARSGTGKSTHIGLWKEVYGERVRIINGDKPIVRYRDGQFLAYGTPWCGKENQGINGSTPLSGICFLERAEKNTIRRIEPKEVAVRLLHQVLMPEGPEEMAAFMELLDCFLTKVPCYVIGCNMEQEAAVIACQAMRTVKEKR